jgi:hypothetical protein
MIHFAPDPGSIEARDAFVRRLLQADWESDTGSMRLSPNLTLADLADAPFFQNTRVLMTGLAAEQGTPATGTGNLNRAFVGRLFPQLALSPRLRDSIRSVCPAINEQDLWPLHVTRVVAERAGLVARRNKRFQLTRVGRELLPDDQAGALYRRVFLAYFRKFSPRYHLHLLHVPLLRQSMAVILWRLHYAARDWTPVRGLAFKLLMPQVFMLLHIVMAFENEKEESILSGYVLQPLLELGLLERMPPSEWGIFTSSDNVQVSPLWRKFIYFEPWTGGAR